MKEEFTILVENFNTKELKYEFGKQQIIKTSIPSLKNIIREFNFGEEVLIPPRVITNRFIIQKLDDEMYFFYRNYKYSYFMLSTDILNTYKTTNRFKLDELEDIFERPESSKARRALNIFLNIIDRSWFFYVVMNFLFFLFLLIQEANKTEVNMILLIFLVWLIIFCIYSLSYGIYKTFKLRKENRRIKIEYSIPFINSFNTVDVSEAIIVFGQFFLYGFTTIYDRGFHIARIIPLIFLGVLVILVLLDFKQEYNYNYFFKHLYLQWLLLIVHNHLNGEEKQTYLHICTTMKEKPLLSSEKLPKFFTLFSLLLTFIPIISYLFIYS